jgi:putative FmdB family regulatory protein
LPLYEYECPKCGVFERMQKFSDPVLRSCPTCGQPVEKLLSPPAIQFKGSGWYVTDYAGKSSGGKDEKNSESKDTKTSDTSSSASKDSGSDKKTSSTKSDK